MAGFAHGSVLSVSGRNSSSVAGIEMAGTHWEDAPKADHPSAGKGPQELRQTCHDMRQTVAAVQTLADAALADGGLQGPARAHVEKIASQAEILADTISQQLHPAGGDQKLRSLIDLRRLVSDVAEAERVTYQGTLEVIGDSGTVLIDAGRDDVRRVLSNLLSNATRAAGPTGNVAIEVKADAGLTEAEVVIDNTMLPGAKAPQGTGLGWSIIIQLLTKIEGKLAYGEGRRGGVRATLWLPLAVC